MKRKYISVIVLVLLATSIPQSRGSLSEYPPKLHSGEPGPQIHLAQKLEKRFTSPGKLPAFFLNPESRRNKCFIGISDPGMDSSAAVGQALQRAAIIEALSHKTELNFITDYYIKMIHNKKWEVFAHLFEVAGKTGEMKADSVMINQFGEAIVKASPVNKILSEKKRIMLSGFIQEKTYGGLADYIYRFELKNPVNSVFLVRMVNDNYSVETLCAGKEMKPYPSYNYHYQKSVPSDTSWTSPGFSMKSGLWPSFFGSILKSLFLDAKATAEYEVGNMRDTYSEELDARLKRQTGYNTFTMSYKGCDIYNNRIHPHLKIYPKK